MLKNEKYSIDFKFCQKNKKILYDKDSIYKIKLTDDNMFSFKLSIKYLKINPEIFDILIKKNSSEFVIIPSKKSRRRFLSGSFYKKSSTQLLNDLENNEKEKKKNNNNNNNDDYLDDRRLSYEPEYNTKKYINSKFKDKENTKSKKIEINENGSICSNEEDDNLSLMKVKMIFLKHIMN